MTAIQILTDNRNAILQAIEQASREAQAQAAQEAAQKMRERVPVDTGRLRDSIVANEAEGTVEVDAPYGLLVELGSSTTPARPFALPAFDEVKDQISPNIAKKLESSL